MTQKNTKKMFGAEVAEELADSFVSHCEEKGFHKFRALEASLRTFMVLPPEAQVALMSNNVDARKLLIDTFRDISLMEDLQQLPAQKQAMILALAKEVAKQVSRK